MFAPDDVYVLVGRWEPREDVEPLGVPELFLCGLARDLPLQHHVAVIRRSDDAPAVLGENVDEAGDLRQTLRLFGDVLAQPCRVGVLALPWILAIQLVTDGPEDVNEDVGRTGHGRSHGVTPAPQRSGSQHRTSSRTRRARRACSVPRPRAL